MRRRGQSRSGGWWGGMAVLGIWKSHCAVDRNRKSSVSLRMSGVGGKADFDFGRLDVCL